jgi:hypothetical protein
MRLHHLIDMTSGRAQRENENLYSTFAGSSLLCVVMSVDILYSTDLRRPLAFALALGWWR